MSQLLAEALDLARARRHPVVLPEHLLRAAVARPAVHRWLAGLGHDAEALGDDVDGWLDGLNQGDGEPRVSATVTRLGELIASGTGPEEGEALVGLAGLADSQAAQLLRRRGILRPRLAESLGRLDVAAVPHGVWQFRWEERPIGVGRELEGAWEVVGEAPLGGVGTPNLLIGAGGDEPEGVVRTVVQATARLGALPAEGAPAVWLVSRGGAAGAALLALGRVLALERPDLRVRRLALETDTDLRGVVAAELAAPEASDEVRVEGGRRFVPKIVPVEGSLPEPHGAKGGTLVITGGLGAVGVRIARHLALRFERVVLVGRSLEHPEAHALRAELGRRVDVRLVAADVTDREAMSAVLFADGPRLRVVVHAAGVLDDALLPDHDAARVERVMSPKVAGAAVLLSLLEGRAPEALVFVSSVAGALGSPGQGAYAAANAALDHLAVAARARGVPVASVAFGPWAEAGMSVEHLALQAARGLVPMSTPRALHLLDAAMRLSLPFVAAAIFDDLPTLGQRGAEARAAFDEAQVLTWIEERVRPLIRKVYDPDQRFDELGVDSLGGLEVRRALIRKTGVRLGPTVIFTHPTPRALAAFVCRPPSVEPVAELPAAAQVAAEVDGQIAIIGVGCRLPGGVTDPERFWALLTSRADAIVDLGSERFEVGAVYDPSPATPGRTCARKAGLVADLADFDPAPFGIPAWEARWIDPQHRLLLEGCAEALASAGLRREDLAGPRTGVFVGLAEQSYAERLPSDATRCPSVSLAGLHPAFATGRLAGWLGARGPMSTVNTACSSSLVALHEAVSALRSGRCSTAVVAGAQALCSSGGFVALSQLGMLSPTDTGRAWDAEADGYVRGEGCVVMVLRRASDALAAGEPIVGLIRGTAVGHGGGSAGLLVPSVEGEEEVMRAALADAGVEAADVALVECHAVGAPLADVVETAAVSSVYGRDRAAPVVLSSVKPVIGHLEAAAGLASLLKVLLVFRHGRIPGQLHLGRLHPDLTLDGLRLATEAVDWPAGERPRLAGVSAFGLGGTNAHVVVEEPPRDRTPRPPAPAPVWSKTRHWISAAPEAPRAELGARADLLAFVRVQLAELTGRASLEVSEEEPLGRHGLDSMRALELRARLLRAGQDVPLRVLMLDPSLVGIAEAARPVHGATPGPAAGESAPQASLLTHGVAVVVGMVLALLLLWALRLALPDYAPAPPDLRVFPSGP